MFAPEDIVWRDIAEPLVVTLVVVVFYIDHKGSFQPAEVAIPKEIFAALLGWMAQFGLAPG
jgi:hypothetical protein